MGETQGGRALDTRHVVLKLFMEALGEEPKISDFDNRKIFQKAIYLVQQLSRIDLGYRYGWYIRGPYSTELARDYYQLAEAIDLGETTDNHSLISAVEEKLSSVRALLDVPADCQISKSSWLELLASWHYLRFVNKLSEDKALEIMRTQKPALAPYVPKAKRVIQQHGVQA
jgi:uncharacterized protein YwgA